MPASERQLLHNALDALDRLYDRESTLVDVHDLFVATAAAMSDETWRRDLDQVAALLLATIRSGKPTEEQYRTALVDTDDLRLRLADYYR